MGSATSFSDGIAFWLLVPQKNPEGFLESLGWWSLLTALVVLVLSMVFLELNSRFNGLYPSIRLLKNTGNSLVIQGQDLLLSLLRAPLPHSFTPWSGIRSHKPHSTAKTVKRPRYIVNSASSVTMIVSLNF